ncbi:septum formation initiator [Micromonospora sp. NPDC048830]|uniref:septum formation initiator n=1 Tax=Micromonospora sp. NPDC048830 TaxID=3364257 RepID=UPI0037127D90
MGRHPFLAVVGWLVTVAVATVVGLAAIPLVGDSITGTPGGVRSARDVAETLASPVPSPATSGAGASPSAGPAPTGTTAAPGATRQFSARGGSAVAECGPAGVRLVYWTPAQGYRAAEVERGPGHEAKVRFVGPDGRSELKVRCAGGHPVLDD